MKFDEVFARIGSRAFKEKNQSTIDDGLVVIPEGPQGGIARHRQCARDASCELSGIRSGNSNDAYCPGARGRGDSNDGGGCWVCGHAP
jgi:hypothetical protein